MVLIILNHRMLLLQLTLFLAICPSSPQREPFAMRISCGAHANVQTGPTNTLWYKDFSFTGGRSANASRTSFIVPPLPTVRYFPLSDGPENCYNINGVPNGHYSVRIFFALVQEPYFQNEPLFDVSVEGTQIYSLPSGWSTEDEESFAEALVFVSNGSVSTCFHSTGHGDPAILSLEILQVDDKAYYFGPLWGEGLILRTVKRVSCGNENPEYDEDYGGDPWGGDRFWSPLNTFGQYSDKILSTVNSIKQASVSPNYYPEKLYHTALVSTDSQSDLSYTIDVDPTRNYSIWLHFAEIDSAITGEGQRVFDILINGDTVFNDVDIIQLSGSSNTALVLNKTVAVNGRTLTVTIHPTEGNHSIINAIEVFEVIPVESKTLAQEVKALQVLKNALGLPLRLGWNGDPCVPQQHPWSGIDCQFDGNSSKWVIDGLGLDTQGLRGFLPNNISQLLHLQSINLSGNSILGAIPSSLGTITGLQILDLSYNFFNGSIPESLGSLTSLEILNLNSNMLSGRVPAALGGRLLHRASFNFTTNAGLCGIPGLPTCGPHLSIGATIGIVVVVFVAFILTVIGLIIWWKRRQNILRAQRIAARDAPYAKARTHFVRDVQMNRHHHHHHGVDHHSRAATEHGPNLLS
ncbi:receptor-like protein 4 [Telopea speciosissima]|uniref:receptor-like protein 4 n=1 Tax=Telopea speciosissima TaxID=54955 RepID=UPI001CC7DAE3|nr:receptor-like protein 4 [Telopea speciosissima]XP_043690438.1 receptor-like protein 4 [Telopea speciosissima]